MRHSLCLLLPVLVMTMNPARGESPADVLDKASSKFAKSGDLKVHYKSLGEGKTALVLIHGWRCDHTVWREQAAAFNGKVRMLFVDLPGYGKSDKPKIDYTMDVFAKGIDAVLQDAGVEQAVLAGHNMGTPVVRQFYRLYPDKTKALIFVDGALRPFAKDKAQAEQFASRFKEDTFKDTAPAFLASMFPKESPMAFRDQIETLVKNATPSVAISSWRGMLLDEKIWKEDPVKVPAQAIMAKSAFWTEDYKAFVKKLVPDLDYREFDGVGHFLFMEKPKEINEALSEFLTKQGLLK
jgi:pimeloyl-ACP methyl ester carboxylesterase